MKLLMTTDTVGGVWTYVVELSRALGEHGVQIVLATMGATPTPQQREEVRQVENVRLVESAFKLEWMNDPWDDIRKAGRWLLDLEDEFRPDVVHLNGYAHGALPFRAPVMVVGHSCVLSWWQAVKNEPAPASWDRYRREVAAGLGGADTVVAPSRAMLHALETHYGTLPSPRVIYNGRDTSLYRPRKKESFVFAAGRLWDEAKNLSALVAAAPKMPWPIHVAGDSVSPDGAAVDAKHVKSLGKLDPPTLASWLGRAGIYVLPAKYEPFGLSVLEAALCECPLVLGDIASLREIWGDAAIFVPPNDPDALARAVDSLARSRMKRFMMGRLACERAQRYTLRRMVDGYLSAYETLQRRRARELQPHADEANYVPNIQPIGG